MKKTNKTWVWILTCYYSLVPTLAMASSNGQRIITKMQTGAFWLGIALAIWGAYEWQIGGPSGIDRIKKAVFGYIAILLVPLLFVELRSAFTNMSW